MTRHMIWGLGAVLCVLPTLAVAGERVKAEIDCATTDKALVYDCTIMLRGKDSGQPVAGAEIAVNASMPSMPMAHNVRPVTAMPMGGPGGYRARIELQMYGDWVLTLDISGPTRDRIVESVQFGEAKADATDRDHGKMKMEGMQDGGMKDMKEMRKTE